MLVDASYHRRLTLQRSPRFGGGKWGLRGPWDGKVTEGEGEGKGGKERKKGRDGM